jgi:hypothetical protein
MGALKKAYERDLLTLQEFLAEVRKLSKKQFKSNYKRVKIVQAI